MNADLLKVGSMYYARRIWKAVLTIDEYSSGYSDVWIVLPNMMTIDIEVKVSMSDLRADLKKDKHLRFKSVGLIASNYLIYAVPEELKEQAKKYIVNNIPYASLIAATGCSWGMNMNSTVIDMCTVIKRKKLHDKPLTEKKFRFAVEQLMRRYISKYAQLNGIRYDPES